MKVQLPTNHNYYEEKPLNELALLMAFGAKRKSAKKIRADLFSSVTELTSKNIDLDHFSVFGFSSDYNIKDRDKELILKIYAKKKADGSVQYFLQTGKFAGVLYYKGYQFNIVSAYGDAFLKRMLNCVNNIFVNNQEAQVQQDHTSNEFQQIIAYLFIQSLERSAILGLPRKYQTLRQTSHKVRGTIDINAYIKHHIPFKGQLTTILREQRYVQEIIDVLYVACHTLRQKFTPQIHRKIAGIYHSLKQHYSGQFPRGETISIAKQHSVLHNPMYAGFKSTLRYAEIIIQERNMILADDKSNLNTKGYLFDIADLFELYLERTISRRLEDWFLSAQTELHVYQNQFYGRRMLPDFVLHHKYSDKCIVFDAKFKKMRLEGRDLDRSDFYQIHSYIKYYMPKVVLGGLVYPLSVEQDIDQSHASHVFDNTKYDIGFIVEGIYVDEDFSQSQVIEQEELFLDRLEQLVNSRMANTG